MIYDHRKYIPAAVLRQLAELTGNTLEGRFQSSKKYAGRLKVSHVFSLCSCDFVHNFYVFFLRIYQKITFLKVRRYTFHIKLGC